MEEQRTHPDEATPETARRKKPLWRRILRVAVVTFSAIVVLVAIAIGYLLYKLSPESLTPMFEKYSSEYLQADVTAEKVELSFWESFPKVTLVIDGMKVRSRTLDGLSPAERAKLPADADSLLEIKKFKGGVNVWALTMGQVILYDVEIERPALFLVKVNDAVDNYSIFPKRTGEKSMPRVSKVSINNFAILGDAPVRYYAPADSTDLTLRLKASALSGINAPQYSLDLDGTFAGRIADFFDIPSIPVGFDGNIEWNQEQPKKIGLKNFTVNAADIALTINTDIEFDSSLVCKNILITGKNIDIAHAINLIPKRYRGDLDYITTDISADINIAVLDDFYPRSYRIPSMNIDLLIPGGSLSYNGMTIDDIKADISAKINGNALNSSVIDINNISVFGNKAKFILEGRVTSPLVNPLFEGRFKGMLDFKALPRQLADKFPFVLSGDIDGQTEFRFRARDLTRTGFHNINAHGMLALRNLDFAMRDTTARLFTKYARLNFGTAASAPVATQKIDSLLSLSLTADSVFFSGEGVRLNSKGIKMSANTKNSAELYDTTKINPLDIVVSAEKLRIHSIPDSLNMSLTNPKVKGLLQRYKNQARRPLLTLDISTQALRYSDPVSRISLKEADLMLQVHPKTRLSLSDERRKIIADSLRQANSEKNSDGHLNLDFNLDRSLMSWLRHWDASGKVKAARGSLMTPYFPVRNTLSNVDVDFSTDSMVIRNLNYRMGKSDFNINGKITNILGALSSVGSPIKIDFDINCDTLDLNNITSAIIAGSAYADKVIKGNIRPIETHIGKDNDTDDDLLRDKISRHMNDSARAPFIVPWNIDARLNLNANSLLYADIWFQKINGNIGVKDGAIHIDRFAGYTPIGSMDISALYSAPDKDNLKFAAGAVVRDLQLKQFIHLLPEIEAILPLLKEVNGIVTADVAMTTDLDSLMNMKFHTFHLVLKLQGRDLTLVDTKDFIKIAKLLRLEHDGQITINSMQVELMVKDSHLDLFPFVFDFDKYKFGVSGGNDINGQLDYHIAVLKSPIPFAFGVNIKGRPGHLHFGLGRADFDADRIASSRLETDTLRINLVDKIETVFKFGVKNGHYVKLMEEVPKVSPAEFLVADTLTHADSLIFMQAGVFEGHDIPPFPETDSLLSADRLKLQKRLEKEREKRERRLRKEEEKAIKRKEKEELKAIRRKEKQRRREAK